MLTKFFVILLVLFNSAISFAAPPKYVYRIDSRPPDDIFNNGFSSWGQNNNVFSHISGASCVEQDQQQRDSGFISTSANSDWSMAMTYIRSRQFTNEHIYLYRIRADEHFYNAVSSLELYARNNPDTVVSEFNYVPARTATEYITPHNILSENIDMAVDFFTPDGGDTVTNSSTNSNYRDANTRASTQAYGGTSDTTRRRFTWVRYVPIIGACMSSHDEFKKHKKGASAHEVFKLEALFMSGQFYR